MENVKKLLQTFAGDSTVLLKNQNQCLPLARGTKLNLFGYNATDLGFLITGGGSGCCAWVPEESKLTLAQAFREAGVQINEELLARYTAWDNIDLDSNAAWNNGNEDSGGPGTTLSNPPADFYTEELLRQARDFSDTAVVVLSRYGKENGYVKVDGVVHRQIPFLQLKSKGLPVDRERTYLQISTEEELMLQKVKENFAKVIVLINTCNDMELGFLEDAGIDAALFIGTPGQGGAAAIPQLLFGEVTPSGKLADTYPYHHQADPTWANPCPDYRNEETKQVTYQEGIYSGYRWYETAFADKAKISVNGYDLDFSTEEGYRKIVQYPFGYGLSYTTFSWEITEKPGDTLEKDGVYTVKVKVTNTGKAPGKDVAQLYVTAPYTPGGIEKAAVSLVDFGKTETLAPGQSQELALSFTSYDLASFDCYDANKNGFAGYELEKGVYQLKLMKDAHTLVEAFTMGVAEDIFYPNDPVTGVQVENRFTGENSYGSPVDGGVTYMTRADFAGTFPRTLTIGKMTKSRPQPTAEDLKTVGYGVDSGMYLFTKANGEKATLEQLEAEEEKLVCNQTLLGQLADYEHPVWDTYLSQLSKEETIRLIKDGGFRIAATASLGLPKTVETDGPSGLSRSKVIRNGRPEAELIGWPAEALIGCSWNRELMYRMGETVGKQARRVKIAGWYAPGVNLHRSPYTSRNFEYYSEDPVLTGKLATQVISGAKGEGLTCYIKHFAVSEDGKNPVGVNTWLTEQTMRQLYLKPFERAVKQAGVVAVMSAFNNIGDVYCGHNAALLQNILRDEWGFRGCVITDWWGEQMTVETCVLSGNDKMLTPPKRADNTQTIDLSDDAGLQANAARTAVKNIIYSFVAPHTEAK